MAEKCNECLFTPERIVSSERAKELLRQANRKDIHFVCHKATIKGRDICCRGFYDTQTSQMIRISQRLNCVDFIKEKDIKKIKRRTNEWIET